MVFILGRVSVGFRVIGLNISNGQRRNLKIMGGTDGHVMISTNEKLKKEMETRNTQRQNTRAFLSLKSQCQSKKICLKYNKSVFVLLLMISMIATPSIHPRGEWKEREMFINLAK